MTTTIEIDPMTNADVARRCFDDPVYFARSHFRMSMTRQQAKMLRALAEPGAHVAAASGHGIGKSTALAVAALWFLMTRESPLVVCTAPTAHQLSDVLWGELRRLHARLPEQVRGEISITRDHAEMYNSTGSVLARTARPENPDALQGFHRENILYIIDEASGVPDKVFEVAYGALTTSDARAIMTGNPTRLSGFFHKIFHTENNWVKFRFSSIDSPLVSRESIESFKTLYQEDSDQYRVRVLGEFPLAGMDGIIPADEVLAALHRVGSRDDPRVVAAPVILSVDPAWDGPDRSVIVMRQGIFAKVLYSRVGASGDELARQVITYSLRYGSALTMVDKTGVGASCCDFLKAAGHRHVRIHFNAVPDDPNMFFDKRAEMWWRMREWFADDSVMLEDYPGFASDLTNVEYGSKDNGKIFLESKRSLRKRGLRSPDLGDSLAMTFYFPEAYLLRFVKTRESGGVVRNSAMEDARREWCKGA